MGPNTKKQIPWQVLQPDGTIVTDEREILDVWKDAFHGLLTPPDTCTEQQQQHREYINKSNREREEKLNVEPNTNNDQLNYDFSIEEVSKVVFSSKNGKAPGYDGIINEVLKNGISIRLLTTLFNLCLRSHCTPSVWAKGIISPIPKCPKNDMRIPLNYRGISLLPVTSKLYTASISNRLSKFLEKNKLLANKQNGFRPNRSCLDRVYSLHNLCKIRKNLKLDTFLTFIDFQKAFDYVSHEFLYHKLPNMNITGDIYHSIKSIYKNPKSCVQLNGQLTGWFDISSGVRQGDSLSPTLFAIFINDMADEMRKAHAGVPMGGEYLDLLMYADDVVLISPSADKAQSQLDIMAKWCNKWGMSINQKKSQIVHIRNHQKQRCNTILNCGGKN